MQNGNSKFGYLVAAIVVAAVAVAIAVVLRTDTTGDSGSGLPKDYRIDWKDARKTDPKLITHDEGGKIELKLDQARGLAVGADDTVYVAGDRAIARISKDGSSLPDIALDGEPACLAVAADGAIYVGMREHVEVYAPSGERKAVWDSRKDAHFTGIAVDDEDVFVADSGKRVLLHYNSDGTFEKEIGSFNLPSPHLDVAVGPRGLLWVNNPGKLQLEGYTFRGDKEVTWGAHSSKIQDFCGCCNPTNVAVLPDGRFVTSEKGLPRVKIYAKDGAFMGVVAGTELFGKKAAGLDLAVDSQGRILVLDPAAKVVRIFTPKVKE